jgi:catechol 2,3-dioxygenase-like lactoylglutathione lyase family enzyme
MLTRMDTYRLLPVRCRPIAADVSSILSEKAGRDMKRLITAAFFLTSTILMGQSVLGVGNFIHVVGNLDRSIEFYHDALGLEMTGPPGPRAFSANAVVSSLYDALGAQSRVASFKIPDSDMAVEIVEFQGLNAMPVRPRFFDPGAITLSLVVNDIEATETRLHRIKGLEWIGASRNFSVMVSDPDGIFVQLQQVRKGPSPVGAAADDPKVRLGVTVEDPDRTAGFYQEALGFTGRITGGGSARLQVPGDAFPVDFGNPMYVDRNPVHSAIHDPGSGVLRLRVGDFDAVVKALRAAGARIVSAGGEPVNLGRNRAVILRGMDNLFLQVLESAPAAGKGPATK